MHSEFNYAELTFNGLYNPQIVEHAYRHLPGVAATEFAQFLGDGSNIYVSRAEATWHYVFDLAGGDCPAGCTEHELYFFAVTSPGLVQTTAMWKPQNKTNEDHLWTELTIELRGSPNQRVDIDPISMVPLVLQVRASSTQLAEQTARFIVQRSGGQLQRIT